MYLYICTCFLHTFFGGWRFDLKIWSSMAHVAPIFRLRRAKFWSPADRTVSWKYNFFFWKVKGYSDPNLMFLEQKCMCLFLLLFLLLIMCLLLPLNYLKISGIDISIFIHHSFRCYPFNPLEPGPMKCWWIWNFNSLQDSTVLWDLGDLGDWWCKGPNVIGKMVVPDGGPLIINL